MGERTTPQSPLEVLETYKHNPPGHLTTITAKDVETLKRMIVNHAGVAQTTRYLLESFPRRCEQLVEWSMFDALGNNKDKTRVLTERLEKLLTEAAALHF